MLQKIQFYLKEFKYNLKKKLNIKIFDNNLLHKIMRRLVL